MIRIFVDNFVPKYSSGKWQWNDELQSVEFISRKELATDADQYIKAGGYTFLAKMNAVQELIFRKSFQRPETTHDGDVILTQDIKDLVLFLAPTEMMTEKFIAFVHTQTVDRFLHKLIMYFECFLKMVEFVLIRRDEISGDLPQLQSTESTEIKRIYSSYLTQYRLLLAREYSRIILGEADMKRYYHIKPIVNISQTTHDKNLHEQFLAFSTQVVWIAMHRHSYDIIDMEMSRLFRSEHFKLTSNERIQFSPVEANMLYGINYRRVNYRAQNSPVIQELKNVANENLPILWIGVRKYRGTDRRILDLEIESLVPDSQLCLIDVVHGILGHPKKIYDTLLNINWEAVRFQKYTTEYDPYHIMRQPHIKVPQLDEEMRRKHAKQFDFYYKLQYEWEPLSKVMLNRWIQREELIEYYKIQGFVTDVCEKGEKEAERKTYGDGVEEIMKKFLAQKEKLRKK